MQGLAESLHAYADHLFYLGRGDEALEPIQKAVEIRRRSGERYILQHSIQILLLPYTFRLCICPTWAVATRLWMQSSRLSRYGECWQQNTLQHLTEISLSPFRTYPFACSTWVVEMMPWKQSSKQSRYCGCLQQNTLQHLMQISPRHFTTSPTTCPVWVVKVRLWKQSNKGWRYCEHW